jgi:hypothetical protein
MMVWDLDTMRKLNGPWPDSPEGVEARLLKLNPDARLLEPRDVYDVALVDLTDAPNDHWVREEGVWVAVYDTERCIEAIMEWLNCDPPEAWVWFDFSTSDDWMGQGTPTFRHEH